MANKSECICELHRKCLCAVSRQFISLPLHHQEIVRRASAHLLVRRFHATVSAGCLRHVTRSCCTQQKRKQQWQQTLYILSSYHFITRLLCALRDRYFAMRLLLIKCARENKIIVACLAVCECENEWDRGIKCLRARGSSASNWKCHVCETRGINFLILPHRSRWCLLINCVACSGHDTESNALHDMKMKHLVQQKFSQMHRKWIKLHEN